MSLLKTGTVQVGQSGAASNNFHWRNPPPTPEQVQAQANAEARSKVIEV